MIELYSKTQQDFLNRKWVKKLLDAGVDMSDAKYNIGRYCWSKNYYIFQVSEWDKENFCNTVPTYTVSELFDKLPEFIYPTIDNKKYRGCLKMTRDLPFYTLYYSLDRIYKNKNNPLQSTPIEIPINNYICADYESLIESLASLLIQCHQKDIGIKTKHTGDICNK